MTAMLLLPQPAGAESMAEVVKKYELIGTWAPDCSKPADRVNPHVIYRLLDGNRLQRRISIESDRTTFQPQVAVSIVESGLGEITMVWKAPEGTVTNRVRAYPGQMQVLDSIREDGEKFFVNGRSTRDNTPAPKYNKCS